MTMEMMIFLNHLMMYLSTFGFGFAFHNALIGISRIKNLKELSLVEIKAHKMCGRVGGLIFYILAVLCIIFATIPRFTPERFEEFFMGTIFWHTFLGGIIAFIFFTLKLYFAKWNKDTMYSKGKIIGPIGFTGWALSYFTSNIDFYFFVNPIGGIPTPFLIPNYLTSIIISLLMGIAVYAITKIYNYKKFGILSAENLHGVAMILHGIAFGYEGSAKELIGAPVLYKYVFPKTYEFIERYAEKIGLNLEKLKEYNINEAMEIAMKRFAEIGMAEKIQIEWLSENEFSVESINCSTAIVRSLMKSEELINSICPWGLLSAAIINKLTGKNIELEPSEFTEIGAKTKLRIVEKTQ